MDEQAILHRISVDYDINIELLKDVYHDEKFFTLIKAGKKNDAILHLRTAFPNMGLAKAKIITDTFSEAIK